MRFITLYCLVQTVVMVPVGILCIMFFLGMIPPELGGLFSLVALLYSFTTMYMDRLLNRYHT